MATRTIATKLTLDGEAEYKKSLKNINSELGVLKSELKLVEAQFKGQSNSYEALQAKGTALEKVYEQQNKKLELHTNALKEAQKVQNDYTQRIADAQKEIAGYEAALAALGEQSGDTGEEQERLAKSIKDTQAALNKNQDLLEQATRKANSYQTQVNNTQAELSKLSTEIQQNAQYLDEAANSSDGCAKSIDQYGKAVKQTAEKTEDAAEKTSSFADKLKTGLANSAKVAATALAAVGTAAVAGVKMLLDLAESTEAYRVAQGKLNTAFEAAGMSTETASEAYQSLYAVLGDTDNATESAQLLATLARSEEDVAAWADIAAGVTGTFGDALPIPSLIEAANETAKVGKVTGALADALNWAGISEDEFNEKLAACANESERTALITETLNSTYQNATAIFKENNKTVMEARTAQAALDDALAALGGTVADVKTELTAEFMPAIAAVVEAFSALLTGADGAEETFAAAVDGLVAQAADKLPELLEFGSQIVLSLVGGIANAAPSLTEGAMSVIVSLLEGLLSALPQVAEAAVQVIAALVQGIGDALPTLIPAATAAVMQLVQALVDNIPLLVEVALALVSGLAEGVLAAIPVLLAALPTLLESLVSALLEAIPTLIETGVTLLTALVENLPLIIETIIAVLPQIITSITSTLLSHLPEIVEAGITLLTAVITDLPAIIATIVGAMPQIIAGIVGELLRHIPEIVKTGATLLLSLITDLPSVSGELGRAMPDVIDSMVDVLSNGVSKFAGVGANLVRGLWDGIQSLAGWLWNKVYNWVSDIWDGVCDFFGIESPSKKMAWVSKMNVEGAVVGIEQNKDKAVKAYGDMGAAMYDEVETGLSNINARFSDSIGEIETGFSAKATIETVAAATPSRLSVMPEQHGAAGSGDTTVTNHFHIGSMVVREEADVKRVAKELYNMQKTKSRSKGVVA